MTHTTDPTTQLHALIRYEERRVVNTSLLERRRGLMEIVRSMDIFWTSLNSNFYQGLEGVNETSQLMIFGLNKAISLFMDNSCLLPGFPLSRTNKELQNWADSVLIHCGRLGLCEHLLEVVRVGLGEIQKEQQRLYRFRYVSELLGLESMEREDFAWQVKQITRNQEMKQKALQERETYIWEMISRTVNTWNKYYIQYETHPIIDEYYQEAGLLNAQRMFGQDSFPGTTKFGGQDFDLYRATVGVLIGWALKHLSFCTQLMKKVPNINPRNIITVPQHFHDKAIYLSYALDIDVEVAKQALQVLTLTLENKAVHCSVPGNFAAPALIEAGQGRVIVPVWGCTSHPFLFMLNELKRRFRSDWDRAVEHREAIFRGEIYQLFPGERFLKLSRNINIRIGRPILTDIDALIFDRRSGIIALFQLKWQDFFGNSMRERESRKNNLQQTGNRWVDRVHHWLSINDTSDVGRALSFSQDDTNKIKGFRLFVIGRNAAHFSGNSVLDSRAAWGTWYQLARLIAEEVDLEDPLGSLHTLMINNSPAKRQQPILSTEELTIRDTTIIIEAPPS